MKIKVSVPATSANVGSGFDALGLAVTLYNTVTFEENGEAAYLIDTATAADVAEITKKIEVLGGKVALAMKKLEE